MRGVVRLLKQENIKYYNTHPRVPQIEKNKPFWYVFGNHIIRNWRTDTEGLTLDICCGAGYVQQFFSCEMVNLDISKQSLHLIKRKPRIVGDAEALPLKSNSTGVITIFGSLHHLLHPETALNECYRVLKNSGRLYIVEGSPERRRGRQLYHSLGIPNCLIPSFRRFSNRRNSHIHNTKLAKKELLHLIEQNGFTIVNCRVVTPIVLPQPWFEKNRILSELIFLFNHTPLSKYGLHIIVEAIKE